MSSYEAALPGTHHVDDWAADGQSGFVVYGRSDEGDQYHIECGLGVWSEADVMYIFDIGYVNPDKDLRKKGVGRALVLLALHTAYERGFAKAAAGLTEPRMVTILQRLADEGWITDLTFLPEDSNSKLELSTDQILSKEYEGLPAALAAQWADDPEVDCPNSDYLTHVKVAFHFSGSVEDTSGADS